VRLCIKSIYDRAGIALASCQHGNALQGALYATSHKIYYVNLWVWADEMSRGR